MYKGMDLRKELFKPAQQWTTPTGQEVNHLIDALGMTELEVAGFLGLKLPAKSRSHSTVYRWKAGVVNIPYSMWCMLAHKAGYGTFWLDLCQPNEGDNTP